MWLGSLVVLRKNKNDEKSDWCMVPEISKHHVYTDAKSGNLVAGLVLLEDHIMPLVHDTISTSTH